MKSPSSPLVIAVLVLTFLGRLSAAEPSTGTSRPSRPNVIIILADDLSYVDLGYTGQKLIQTPNIDRLAAEGLRFSEAYSAANACAPSRAGLMTGLHMGHCRIRGNGVQKPWPGYKKGDASLKAEDVTVAEKLKSAGYATGYVGKWGLGEADTEGAPFKKGFDYSFGHYNQTGAHSYYPRQLWENDHEVPIPENKGFKMKEIDETCYDAQGKFSPPGVADPAKAKNSQALVHAAGLDFIRRSKDRPFFLYYATQLPHGGLMVPNLGSYKDQNWPLKNKEWAAMVTWLDQCVGDIVALLRELKLEENTLIIFASDNGYSQWMYLNRPHWEDDPIFKNKGPWPGGKFAVDEGGCRVPMVAYWPKHIRPGESRSLVSFYDFMPTLTELAGVSCPPTDGISLVPELLGHPEQQKKHDYLYWENGGYTVHGQAVRFGPWYAMSENPRKPVTLFDVEKDPACAHDQAGQHPELVERAKTMFKAAHVDSDWYVNPGEADSKKQKEVGNEN